MWIVLEESNTPSSSKFATSWFMASSSANMACLLRSEGVFYAYGCFQLSPLTWTFDSQDIQVPLLVDHLSILYHCHPPFSDGGPIAHHDSQGHLNYPPSLILNKYSASVGYGKGSQGH